MSLLTAASLTLVTLYVCYQTWWWWTGGGDSVGGGGVGGGK